MTGRFTILGAAIVLGSSGCFHCVKVPPAEHCAARTAVPLCNRDAVHVFLVNGLDPIDAGGLTALRDYINGIGFRQTYYGQLYNEGWFGRELARIRATDPEARVVLIGYDAGAETVARLAAATGVGGVPADLVVFIGGRDLTGELGSTEPPARKAFNIRGRDLIADAPSLPGVMNIDVEGANRYTLATHAATRDLLTRELVSLAAELPVIVDDFGPTPPLVTPAPSPRQFVVPEDETLPPEWEFLAPRLLPGADLPLTEIEPG